MIRRFIESTLAQILAIIAISLGATFLIWIVLLLVFFKGSPPRPPRPWPMGYQIISLVRSLRAVPEPYQRAIIAAAQSKDMALRISRKPVFCPSTTLSRGASDLQDILRNELPGIAISTRICDTANFARRIQVLVNLGDHTLDLRTGDIGGSYMTNQSAAALFLIFAIGAMTPWVIWRVTGPLRRLSEKADEFGRDIAATPIIEEGPDEIRRVARAFNLMQERITRSIQDHTRMLAAISHDLRTPLTRMNLQLETEPTELTRGKLRRDVRLMQSMVASTLAFLSGGFAEEEKEWLDLGVLLATLCDEFEEAGAIIAYKGPEQLRFFCRPNAMNRALTNLIENALHFGTQVQIKASVVNAAIIIDVIDNGPGIPAHMMQRVIEPFVRLDPSRSDRPGSVGLGLSIVKEIAAGHQGTLILIDGQPSGLIARLTFPMQAPLA